MVAAMIRRKPACLIADAGLMVFPASIAAELFP